MNISRLGIVFLGLVLVTASVGYLSAGDSVDSVDSFGSISEFQKELYTTKDKEYYLSEDQFVFVGPGLKLTIEEITATADGQVDVRFKIKDDSGNPLDLEGNETLGAVGLTWILATIPEEGDGYRAYTTRIQTSPITGDSAEQASGERNGTYTTIALGEYVYTFNTMLPDGYDADATHAVGVYGARDLSGNPYNLERWTISEVGHFVPSGAMDPQPRDIVSTQTCNTCHERLTFHGSTGREGVEMCVLCHNPYQDIDPDTGNSFDMPLMTHKIHHGVNLTQDYTIIGYRQGVHNYNDVVYPVLGDGAGTNQCESCHTGGEPTEAYPLVADPPFASSCKLNGKGSTTFKWAYTEPVQVRPVRPDGTLGAPWGGGTASGKVTTGDWIFNGQEIALVERASGDEITRITMNTSVFGCVADAPGPKGGAAASNHTTWLTKPTSKDCGSCHDDVNFVTGENHSAANIIAPDDSECALCHRAESEFEFDRSVRGAHTVVYESVQLPGILVQFEEITNTGPGETPEVTFLITDRDGPINPNELQRLRFAIAGPNEDDFDYYVQDRDVVGAAVRAGNNRWKYTFVDPIPMDAEGSYSITVEGRNEVTINPNTTKARDVEDQAQNYLVPFPVTDEAAVARREIVSDAKCETCHGNLSLHGDNRNEATACVSCHQPGASDVARRDPDDPDDLVQNIGMKFMIHKIHAGENLESGYTVLGYRGSVNDFSHVVYPGNLANCEDCHVGNSYQLDAIPAGALPTEANYDFLTHQQAQTAACLSCHDSQSASAHADVNTSDIGESCLTCHGEGKTYSVDAAHAQ